VQTYRPRKFKLARRPMSFSNARARGFPDNTGLRAPVLRLG